MEGVLDMWVGTYSHYYYFTKFCGDSFCSHRIVVGGAGELTGVSGSALQDDAEEVQEQTLALNPVGPSEHWDRGTFYLQILDGVSLYPGEFTFHPPGATYRLHRIAKPYDEPDQIRIKDWETVVKPQITGCESCPNSGGPEWDGTLPEKNGSWNFPIWNNSDAAAINGKALDVYPEVGYESDQWYLVLYCGEGVMWAGRKDVGSDPKGTYVQDLDFAADQCAAGLKCVVVEDY